jgi:hypothetical protein
MQESIPQVPSHSTGPVVSRRTSRKVPAVVQQSGFVQFSQPSRPQRGGGKRGVISGTSDASRKRLARVFACLDWKYLASKGVPVQFATLTTPREYWSKEITVYGARRRFQDALEYRFTPRGYLGAIIRKEYGAKNGMLHYHLIIIGAAVSKAWVEEEWSKALHYEGRVRVDVQDVESAERISKYLVKYCTKAGYEGKIAQEPPGDRAQLASTVPGGSCEGDLSKSHNVEMGYTGGRAWAVWGRKTLPWGEEISVEGDFARGVANRIRRIWRRFRVDTVRKALLKAGPQCKSLQEQINRMSVRQLERLDPFATYLRRSRGEGFVVLLSPELLTRILEHCCEAAIAECCQDEG